MTIAINILNIIDIVLIYVFAIQSDSLKIVIIWTICSGLFFVMIWNKIVERQESMSNLKWFSFCISIITFVGLIVILIAKKSIDIISNFSLVIPMYISYLAMLIKVRREGYDE